MNFFLFAANLIASAQKHIVRKYIIQMLDPYIACGFAVAEMV
jgi:hypothetical protein